MEEDAKAGRSAESRLVRDGVARTLARMALPMLAGTVAINMYNLTNAWFVSRLGTPALAAISFTLPVTLFLMFLTRGLSSGSLTLVAHAIGKRNRAKAAALTTHALLLTALYGALLTIAGFATAKPLFSRLGASGEVLGMTVRFMRVWYLGATIMALHVVAADVIVSTGNTKAVGLLMAMGTLLNVLLDALLIFGLAGFPRMGITGAALATILSQSAVLAGALYILGSRKVRLIRLRGLAWGQLAESWRQILRFALPGALGMILTPLSAAVVTRLVSGYGNAAVAAIGVAFRIEMFAFMIPMTLGISLVPFMAQNFGAGRMDRIRKARKGAMVFAALYGLFIGTCFFALAGPMAGVFSTEPAVVAVLCLYIRVTCMGYGMLEVHRYAGFTLTGLQRPMQSTLLNAVRVLVLLVPLVVLGNVLFHLAGVFWGRLAADLLSGCAGIWWSGRFLPRAAGPAKP